MTLNHNLAHRRFNVWNQFTVGETDVSRDTFYFFSNIAENIYDRDFDLTRQGRGILPLQTGLISYVVTCDRIRCQIHVVELSQPTSSRGRLGHYTGYIGTVLNVGVLQIENRNLLLL